MKNLFENDFLSIQLNEELGCLVYKVGRLPSSSESLRDGSRSLVKASQQHSAKSILVDARGSMGVLSDDVEWNSLHITPRLIQAGIKKIAIVGIDNDMVKMSVQEYMEQTASAPLHQFIFSTEEEAMKWLEEDLF